MPGHLPHFIGAGVATTLFVVVLAAFTDPGPTKPLTLLRRYEIGRASCRERV